VRSSTVGNFPVEDGAVITRDTILARVSSLLAPRIGEEIFLGKDEISTSSAETHKAAMELVYKYVRKGLFNELTGLMNYEDVKHNTGP
jgi:ATP-dependent Zn protease